MPWCEPRQPGRGHAVLPQRPPGGEIVNPSPPAARSRVSSWIFGLAAVAIGLLNVLIIYPGPTSDNAAEQAGEVVGIALGCFIIASLVYGVTRLLRRGKPPYRFAVVGFWTMGVFLVLIFSSRGLEVGIQG